MLIIDQSPFIDNLVNKDNSFLYNNHYICINKGGSKKQNLKNNNK